MSFFQRVLSYVANELLVNRLANSPTFQRFAIRSDATLRELQVQSTQKQAELLSKSRQLARELQENASKTLEELAKK